MQIKDPLINKPIRFYIDWRISGIRSAQERLKSSGRRDRNGNLCDEDNSRLHELSWKEINLLNARVDYRSPNPLEY